MPNYVLQVATNSEFRAQEALERLGYSVVVPSKMVIRRSRGRGRPAQEMDIPIIPGYILFGGDHVDWPVLKSRPEIIGPLGVGSSPTQVSDEVVEYFRNLNFAPLEDHTFFMKGDVVNIRSIPLNQGVNKIQTVNLDRRGREKSADVAVELFGSMRVIKDIPVADLEKVA